MSSNNGLILEFPFVYIKKKARDFTGNHFSFYTYSELELEGLVDSVGPESDLVSVDLFSLLPRDAQELPEGDL